jgi:hypothetical protein
LRRAPHRAVPTKEALPKNVLIEDTRRLTYQKRSDDLRAAQEKNLLRRNLRDVNQHDVCCASGSVCGMVCERKRAAHLAGAAQV